MTEVQKQLDELRQKIKSQIGRLEARGKIDPAEQTRLDEMLAEAKTLQAEREAEIAEIEERNAGYIACAFSSGIKAPFDTDRIAPDQSVADWCTRKGLNGWSGGASKPELSFDRMVKGMATGDWRGAEAEFKAMAEGTLTAGGHLVPTPLSAKVIDLARNAARVFQAGATTVPMTSQTLKVARQTGDPALAWHTEADTINDSSLVFDAVTLTAQTLPCLIKVSLELVEDAPNTGDVISHAVAEAIALELDRVALRGTGTAPQPRGIRNQSGITVQSQGTNGAALTNYDPFLTAIEVVRTANHEPNAVLYSPRTAGTLSRLKDTTNQPLNQPADLAALAKFPTNQIPNNLTQGSASNASDAYVAQWSELLMGIRTTFSIRPLMEKYIDTGQYGFFAYLRADVQLAHPLAFVNIQGIIP